MGARQHQRLIETMRVRGGVAPLFHLHVRRLALSAQELGIPFPPSLTVPSGGPDRVHRLEVGIGGGVVTEREVGSDSPVSLASVGVRHPGYRHKVTDREVFVAAAAEARRAGADDALLLTARGEVAEATIWALFWWEGERVVAPAPGLGILPAVSRARISEILGPPGEARVGLEAIAGRSLFVANAVRGIVPVHRLDGIPVPSDPRTALLQARFWP